MEHSIESQLRTYDHLYAQHHRQRREQQNVLLPPLDQLHRDVRASLKDDKRAYEAVKETFHRKYNLLQRVFTHSATRYKEERAQPLKLIYQQRRALALKVTDLLEETEAESYPLEFRSHWNGAIAVVYDPITGRPEWRQSRRGSVHGAFNPVTRSIEWQEELHGGVYGVFNPKLNIVEWKRFAAGGVHGVYNPSTNDIEWQVSFHSGIGGAYNPLTQLVEWRTSFNGGVVGYFDHDTQTVKWIDKWHHGIALISWDPVMSTYLTTASCGWYVN